MFTPKPTLTIWKEYPKAWKCWTYRFTPHKFIYHTLGVCLEFGAYRVDFSITWHNPNPQAHF